MLILIIWLIFLFLGKQGMYTIAYSYMVYERTSDAPYTIGVAHKDVSEIANQIKKVDDAFINASGNHVTNACCAYLLPLIAGEANCKFENGLPVHLVL